MSLTMLSFYPYLFTTDFNPPLEMGNENSVKVKATMTLQEVTLSISSR